MQAERGAAGRAAGRAVGVAARWAAVWERALSWVDWRGLGPTEQHEGWRGFRSQKLMLLVWSAAFQSSKDEIRSLQLFLTDSSLNFEILPTRPRATELKKM